jgi:uncharacterized cofD-like protein
MSDTNSTKPRVVTIGGGTGSFTLLRTFKDYFTDLTAIVNMADDGGSTGVLRDELGVLPPGDVRQCLVALSEAPELRDLFDYRFSEGSLSGQSFGNIFLSAAEKVSGDFEDAIKLASHVLRLRGAVVPVTTTDARLRLSWPDGETVDGEFQIGSLDFQGRSRPDISLTPQATLTAAAAKAIAEADIVIINPGNLYGSIAPALLVDGMRTALETTTAKVVYACNLVTKPGQTDDFKVHDFAAEIERFIGSPILDYVLYNTKIPPTELLATYTHAGELLVEVDQAALDAVSYQAVGLSLIADKPIETKSGDAIAHSRSLIRHDAAAVAEQLLKLA